ncbi:MAG: type II toxin-antitoxin system VapC family toxin [Chloroflexi bacterium]|nr:type II toxin-antitoxin system VapC family toxin [Chloroflexota bacterium]MCY3583880.1 type II toxin-antitoxin system VapC family toxin [Chloroflexota bacterium]MCY3716160.1 type II toxin-antitoxin system VapC family toxin [Chloroflexota bacterium]MDE2650977.1 type II toxin-antitoxin system VapC family toxin [Chloroflexota bacterium]MXV94175.1 type II toxin-antitoxin system VapC family toxin [Chloroflexota bacterium]
MNCLLDTSTFIWYVSAQIRLSDIALSILSDAGNKVYLSLVSIWELAIKYRTGKLDLIPPPFSEWIASELESNSFSLLEIQLPHLIVVSELPLHHRGPFDRLLIAQSLAEGLPITSSDSLFDLYPINRLW